MTSVAAASPLFRFNVCSGKNKNGQCCMRKPYLQFPTCKHHTSISLPEPFSPTTREEWLEYKETHFNPEKPLVLELFKGTGSIDKAITRAGDMDVVSFDIDKFFQPDICDDFMTFDFFNIFEPGEFFAIWSSPVCTSWSVATHKHRLPKNVCDDMKPLTEEGILGEAMILRLTEVIDYLCPLKWAIENPRGRLRNWKPFVKWLNEKDANRWTVYYGNHNHYLPKATDIWNNANKYKYDYMTRSEKKPGSGHVFIRDISDLTLAQRYAMPSQLCDMIASWMFKDGTHKQLMTQLTVHFALRQILKTDRIKLL